MELSNLPVQALGTLLSRALDGSKEAKDIINYLTLEIGLDVTNIKYTPAATKRADFIRDIVKQVLIKKPNALIFTVGCGFTTYYQELGNTTCTWLDTDLAEITRIKAKIFPYTSNYRCFPLNANKLKITDDGLYSHGIKFANKPDLIVCEGVLMYLDKEVAKVLVTNHTVPMIFDVLGEYRNKPLGEFHKWQYKYNEFGLNISKAKLFDLADSWVYHINGD